MQSYDMVSGIPNIIADLSDDLKARVEAVIQLTEQREELETKLAIAKRDLKRVHIALEALNGSSVPVPAQLDDPQNSTPVVLASAPPVPEPRVLPPPATPARGPTCTSCGSGQMIYTARSLNNGKTVNLWLCSECRNEKF